MDNKMAEQTISELATLKANVQVAQSDVSEIKSDVKQIKANLDNVVISQTKMDSIYVTQAQYREDRQRNWVTNTMSAVLGAVLTGLVSLIVYLLTIPGK